MDIVNCGEEEEEEEEEEGGGASLFEDPDFPSDDRALFSDVSSPLARLQGDVTWRRPQVNPSMSSSP